ncbi:MAG: hypothetical protein MR593_03585 [Intestinibacter sp.]|uniref:hypothetical protein n=1 Tax=Intestinibacter sp. TaxID=1965304 RepID=UPI0025C4FC7D|nr:hypothetical protein [Intestinibacter sp.]MCI6737186.1 hypothetical protein [Intestinibacter sp.]
MFIKKDKKMELPIYNNEIKIILRALNELRNKIIIQGRYTNPIDELIVKINDTYLN